MSAYEEGNRNRDAARDLARRYEVPVKAEYVPGTEQGYTDNVVVPREWLEETLSKMVGLGHWPPKASGR